MHRVFLINVDTIRCHAKWWRLSTVKNRRKGEKGCHRSWNLLLHWKRCIRALW